MALNREGDSVLLFECEDNSQDFPMVVRLPLALMFMLIFYFVGLGFWGVIGAGFVVFFGRFFALNQNNKKTIRLTADFLEVDQERPGIGEQERTWATKDIQSQSVACRTNNTFKRCKVSFRTHSGKRAWVEIPGIEEGRRFTRLLRDASSG